jgi:Tat protein translocase TatB subunit
VFGIGLPELILILVLALIILGPRQIPELAKSIGRGIAELRRMSEDLKGSIEKDLYSEDREKEKPRSIGGTEIHPPEPTEPKPPDPKEKTSE